MSRAERERERGGGGDSETVVEKTRGGGKTDEEEEQGETGVKEGRERSHIVHFSLSVWHPVCGAAPAATRADY